MYERDVLERCIGEMYRKMYERDVSEKYIE